MGFETAFTDKAKLLSENDQIVFGTCMIGTDFGEVKNVSVKRTSDKQEISNCIGGIRGYILRKPRFELQMETRFDADVDAPGEGEMITFPYSGVVGRIFDPEVTWDEGGTRMLKFTATHWDEMADAKLQSWDGTELTDIDSGPPAPAP